MKVLNNKVLFELLDESEQPKKDIFTPNAELLKHGRVLQVGPQVQEIKPGQVVTVYINTIQMISSSEGFCSERDPIFVDYGPRQNKVQITEIQKNPMSSLSSGRVLSSGDPEINQEDRVHFKAGQSLVLPDNTEIISNTQIYNKD